MTSMSDVSLQFSSQATSGSASELAQCKKQVDELEKQLQDKADEDSKCFYLKSACENDKSVTPVEVKLQNVRLLRGHYGKVYAMHWSKTSRDLVSASQDGKLIVWNAFYNTKKAMITLKSSWVMACAFAPNNQYVASGGLENVCSIYKLAESVTSDMNSNQKSSSSTMDSKDVSMNNMQKARAAVELEGHDGYISCVRFLSDTEVLTSSGDHSCMLWDMTSGKCKETFKEHTGDVMSVSVFPDSNMFLSCSVDFHTKLWDMRTPKKSVMTFVGHGSDVNCVQFYPRNYCMFATASDDFSCRLWDVRAMREINKFGNTTLLNIGTCCDFSASGRLLFAGYDSETQQLHIWDTLRAVIVNVVPAHSNRISCLGVSADGHALCTGSWDMNLKVWA